MAVEEVNVSPKITHIDPKTQQKSSSYWEEQAFEARKRREYLQEQQIAREITNPPAPPPPDTPFKVTGGINLGNIDIQDNMRRAEEKAELERKEAQRIRDEEKAEHQRLIADERARREMAEEKARELEMAQLKEQISQQMASLEKMVAQGIRQPKSFMEQYDEAIALTTKLQGNQMAGTEDPKLKLEIMRLQGDMAREEREFKRSWRNDEKKWNLELAKLEIDKKQHAERIEHEKQRNEMFSNAFKNVGAAIATGLQANAGEIEEEAAMAARAPVGRQTQQRTQQPARKIRVQAPTGEAGEIECPECQCAVGVGPNTNKAVCANCGYLFEIDRIQPAPRKSAPRQQAQPQTERQETQMPTQSQESQPKSQSPEVEIDYPEVPDTSEMLEEKIEAEDL